EGQDSPLTAPPRVGHGCALAAPSFEVTVRLCPYRLRPMRSAKHSRPRAKNEHRACNDRTPFAKLGLTGWIDSATAAGRRSSFTPAAWPTWVEPAAAETAAAEAAAAFTSCCSAIFEPRDARFC